MELKQINLSEVNFFDVFYPVGDLSTFTKQYGIKIKKHFFNKTYLKEYGLGGCFVYQYHGDFCKLVINTRFDNKTTMKNFYILSDSDFIIYDSIQSKILCIINGIEGG